MSKILENYIKLGECFKPHGIKGEFSFHLYNLEDSSLEYIKDIFLIPLNDQSSIEKNGQHFKIKRIKINKKTIASLEGVDNRNLTEEMIPFAIYIAKNDLEEATNGEFYLSDIIGLKVIDLEGNELGIVESFYENGAQEVLVIKAPTEYLEIPFVDEFVKEKNIKEGYLRIRPMEFI